METKDPDFITIRGLFDKVRRRKWTLIACVVLSLLLAFLYNRLSTPVYRASAIVSFERFSKDDVLNFDFANASYEARFIANRMNELKTRTFAQNVFRVLPDSIRQFFRLPDSKPTDFDSEGYVITLIQEAISAEQTEKTPNVLTLSFDSENAELAKQVTDTVVDMLKNSSLTYRRQEFASLKQFIDEQIKVAERQLHQAEDALSSFKGSDNITSLEDESREILRRITQAEILDNQIQTDREAKESKLSVIRKKMDEQKKDVSSTFLESSSPTIAKLKEQLVDLEVQLAGLQVQGYSEDHPRRQELTNTIKRTKQSLLELTMTMIQDQNLTSIVDPLSLLRNYLEESVTLEIEIQALLAQQGHLQKILQSYNERLKGLSAKDATLFGLLRDREVNNKHYVRLLEEREEARLQEAADIGTLHVIDEAQMPLLPYTPRKALNIVIALFAGTMVGLLLIFVKSSFNDSPQTYEALEAVLGLPVLASVPSIKSKAMVSPFAHPGTNERLMPLYQDAYVYLWRRIQSSNHGKINSVMISSATPREGKSTVAANLAITAAKTGEKTLLIDGDLRKPSLAKLFNVSDSHGLSNLVSEQTECIHSANPVFAFADELPTLPPLQDLPLKGLKFLGAGSSQNEPGLIWTSSQLREALEFLIKDFDFVVIDSPPVLGIPDAVSIASCVDGIILCVEAEQTDKGLLLRTRDILTQANSNLVGVVWNKVDLRHFYDKYKYQKHYHAAV